MLYYQRCFFWFRAACELCLVYYSSKYDITVSFWYAISYELQVNSNITRCLQLSYTPNNSCTTEDTLFHIKNSCNLQATAKYKHCCLVILCTSMNYNKTQRTYDCIMHKKPLSCQGCIFYWRAFSNGQVGHYCLLSVKTKHCKSMLLTSHTVSYVAGPVFNWFCNPCTGIVLHPTNAAVELCASAIPQNLNKHLVLVVYIVFSPR